MTALAPMRTLNRPKPTVVVERRPDGVLVLSAGRELPEDRPLMIDWLQRAAERRPHVTFLAERRGPDRAWQRLTYAEAWAKTGAVASWLIAQGYGPDSAAGRDPVGQQPRERAVPVRRDARGPAGGADLAQLFAVGRLRAARSCAGLVQPALVFAQDSVAYGKALDRTTARDHHRRRQAWPAVRRADLGVDRCRGRRAAHPHHGRHAGQDPVHLGLDRHGQGRAEHARQSRVGDRDDPHGRRAARPPTHRPVARLAALASHLGRQCQPQQHGPGRRLSLYRRRPAGAGPLPGDAGEPARALAVELRHRAGGLSDAARGARARSRPARQVLQEHARAGLWRRAAAAGELRPAAGRGDRASSASACRSAAAGA